VHNRCASRDNGTWEVSQYSTSQPVRKESKQAQLIHHQIDVERGRQFRRARSLWANTCIRNGIESETLNSDALARKQLTTNMSIHKDTNSHSSRAQKRAEFSVSGQAGSTRKKVFLGILVAGIGAGIYFAGVNLNGEAAQVKPITAASGPSMVKIPLADLESGKAKFFDYKIASNKNIRLFAMKSSDGVYRAALDACDVCYEAKKGYAQEGDDMVCRKCGQHFPSAKVNEVTGGCNPVGITRTVADGHLVIAANDLETEKSFF
jgi:uncharacterized membrane protein